MGLMRAGAARHHTHPHSLTPFPMKIYRAELKFAPRSFGLLPADSQTAIRFVLKGGVEMWLLGTN